MAIPRRSWVFTVLTGTPVRWAIAAQVHPAIVGQFDYGALERWHGRERVLDLLVRHFCRDQWRGVMGGRHAMRGIWSHRFRLNTHVPRAQCRKGKLAGLPDEPRVAIGSSTEAVRVKPRGAEDIRNDRFGNLRVLHNLGRPRCRGGDCSDHRAFPALVRGADRSGRLCPHQEAADLTAAAVR